MVSRNHYPDPIDPSNIPVGQAHHTVFPEAFFVGPKLNYKVQFPASRLPMDDPNWSGFAFNSGTRDSLFVHGFMRYGDIFGAKYILGYCAIFDVIRNRFVRIGGPTLNYLRKEEGRGGDLGPDFF